MIFADTRFESNYWMQGKQYIVGIDEVGRGAWAGPVVVGAVMFPQHSELDFQLADSKLLTAKKRLQTEAKILKQALAYSIAEIPLEIINSIGVGKAVQQGFKKSLELLHIQPDFVLIDAFKIQGYPIEKQHNIIKGDQQSVSIAAASIIAKNYRDKLMKSIHNLIPHYNFDTNVGYGTKQHRDAIAKHGLSLHHRTSFNLTKWLPDETSISNHN